jgi:hypothetical protein
MRDLESRGVRYKYEEYRVKYYGRIRTYIPDLQLPNGIFVEVKGWFTSADRTKHLCVQEQHPELDIRFVFGRASNLINKRSKTTYAMWCESHGFKWYEGRVPEGWINERH